MDLSPLALSLRIAIVATGMAALLGTILGALLNHRRLWGRDLLDAVITAPIVLPPTVLGYYVLVSLGRGSAIGKAYESLTGTSIVFTTTGATIAAFIGALPIVVKAARSAFEGVDPALVEAARTLGATPLRAFLRVEVPLAKRGIVAGAMLGFARSLGDFGVTLMVAGDIPGETQTAALAIYDKIQAGHDREAIGMILILSAVAIGALYAVNKLTGKKHAR
ncbi:MAG: molybdate ABC transporter permease subunit [Myxococcota bacterium]